MTAHAISHAAMPGMTPSKADCQLECRLKAVIDGGQPAIDERLRQLDSEWTAGRAAKATAAVMIVVGLGLGLLLENPWWFVLPIVGGAVLTQYLFGRRAVVGELFHAAGFRTGGEIEQEKLMLKALRGDFQHLPTIHQVEDRDAVTRMEGEGGPAFEHDEPKVDAGLAVRELIGAAKR